MEADMLRFRTTYDSLVELQFQATNRARVRYDLQRLAGGQFVIEDFDPDEDSAGMFQIDLTSSSGSLHLRVDMAVAGLSEGPTEIGLRVWKSGGPIKPLPHPDRPGPESDGEGFVRLTTAEPGNVKYCEIMLLRPL